MTDESMKPEDDFNKRLEEMVRRLAQEKLETMMQSEERHFWKRKILARKPMATTTETEGLPSVESRTWKHRKAELVTLIPSSSPLTSGGAVVGRDGN